MIDDTLVELWRIKDDIAKEQGYDLDQLADYLQRKYGLSEEKSLTEFPKLQGNTITTSQPNP